MSEPLQIDLDECVRRMREVVAGPPEAFIVLGSGWSGFLSELGDSDEVTFQGLPGFPASGVAGHAGRFVSGMLRGRRVLVQAGRFHLYEGHPESVVTAPIRLAAGLGAPRVILTNAAGGIHRNLAPGTPVLLEDHLNLQWRNPLVGPMGVGEVRSPEMNVPYDRQLLDLASRVASELGISVAKGIYAAVLGPNYETPAEIRMLAGLGADLVGMSTVPEVTVARSLGLPVLGLSLVTNRAAGLGGPTLSHDEVLEVGTRAAEPMTDLLTGIVSRLPSD